jgi:hypothetical protein
MRDNPVIARSRDNRRAFAAGSEDRSGQGRGKPSGSADPEQILAASRSRQRSRLFKRVRANLVPICWQRCARMRRSCGLGALVQFGSVARGDATSASDVDLALRPGVGRDRPAGVQTLDHQHSTMPRRSGILMDVHPGLRAVGCRPRNHSFSAQPRRDNLPSSDN